MPISIDKALGNLPAHLAVYSERSSLLASNLANADTPGYKARDIDFRDALAKAAVEQPALRITNSRHLGGRDSASGGFELLYRIPTQPSLDGNTVNTAVEQSEFAQNALRYQSTLTFLSSKFSGLRTAIKGE